MSSPDVPEMLLTQEAMSDAPLTAGRILRRAREAKGLHLAVLSVTIKVSQRQLEALEADQYDAFKGPTFLRAVTSSVCRQLGMDAAPVLALLPSAVSTMAVLQSSIEPLPGPQRITLKSSGGASGTSLRVLLLAVLMAGVTAAFIWMPSPAAWWPHGPSDDKSAVAVEEVAVPMGQASNPEATAVEAPAALAASAAVPPALAAASAPVMPASAQNVVGRAPFANVAPAPNKAPEVLPVQNAVPALGRSEVKE